ncbi:MULTISPECIES: YtxH domain-containing protein [Aequorivita]|uniref:YtxH domain-containing protein n=1 Tax=Aequorivita iocasae TaxID=2803865 RepID=A0ABX7DSQ5_9FLAO|nr:MULTISPECIES: YtxH domain-containing protein [Aequorivita]QQX76179.1 YtxH domain-containing protein [Aequorivita iocasae]UCA55639.1 YtxH domain-containing protein [Aequorivita sp. F7]
METSKKNIALAFLSGALIGSVLGILYAPQKGSKTRHKIKHTSAETARELSEKIKHVKDEIAATAHTKKMEFERSLNSTISNLTDKSHEIIAALEKKLELLKKQ